MRSGQDHFGNGSSLPKDRLALIGLPQIHAQQFKVARVKRAFKDALRLPARGATGCMARLAVDKVRTSMNQPSCHDPLGECWLTEKELAARLNISTRHLINLRQAGLPCMRLGTAVRYEWVEVMTYLRANRRLPSRGQCRANVPISKGPHSTESELL